MMQFGNEKIPYGAFELGRLPNGDLEVSLMPFRLEHEANKRWGTKIKEELEKENEMGTQAQSGTVSKEGLIPVMIKELDVATSNLEESINKLYIKTVDIQIPLPPSVNETKDEIHPMSPLANSLRLILCRINDARYRLNGLNDQIKL
jgi:hypothetical protein